MMPISQDGTYYNSFFFSNEDSSHSETLGNLPKIAQFQNGVGRIRLEDSGMFMPLPSGEHEAASFLTPGLSLFPGKAASPPFIKHMSF